MAKIPAFKPSVVSAIFCGSDRLIMQSAAWRISLWAALAFACGTMIVFVFLHQFVAGDIQRRTDAWLAGEAGVLSDVASRTPKDALNRRVVKEVAELASREVPHKRGSGSGLNDSVFFLQTSTDGAAALWVGVRRCKHALGRCYQRQAHPRKAHHSSRKRLCDALSRGLRQNAKRQPDLSWLVGTR